MNSRFLRSAPFFKESGLEKLENSHVAVFGIGGVGSYVVEGLCRGGIGEITLVDNDEYSITNINRQLYATTQTIGKKKVEVAKDRALSINPDIKVNIYDKFVLQNDMGGIDFSKFDYVVDAIDTISGKIEIIKQSKLNGVPVISAMGAGNKLDQTAFKVADIKDTKVCPLCKVMRKLLKDNGIDGLKVVYSEEKPIEPEITGELKGNRPAPASNSFVPPIVGLIIAGEVIKDIVKI
jgi:tRNA A37 threonylcarbamoyladenosine dehydratase